MICKFSYLSRAGVTSKMTIVGPALNSETAYWVLPALVRMVPKEVILSRLMQRKTTFVLEKNNRLGPFSRISVHD